VIKDNIMYRANNVFFKKYNKKLIWRLNMSFFLNNIKNKWKKTRWKLQKNLVSNLIFQYNIKNFEYLLLKKTKLCLAKSCQEPSLQVHGGVFLLKQNALKGQKITRFYVLKPPVYIFKMPFHFPFLAKLPFV